MANTIWNSADKSANITLSGGNLTATVGTNSNSGVRAVDKQVLGKFYWEYTCTTFTGTGNGVGFAGLGASLSQPVNTALSAPACCVRQSGLILIDSISSGSTLGTITSGSVVCVAVDCTARLVWFRLGAGGNWNGTAGANPATATGGVPFFNLGDALPLYPWIVLGVTNDAVTANFGDTAFTGAVPSGYTSGFTAGVTVSTNALASQVAAEHWLTTNPQAQITQVVVEHWMSVAEGVPVVPSLDTRVMVLA